MSETAYIPYEATAEAITNGGGAEEAVRRIFPDASPAQLEQVRFFIMGLVHDGIEAGLACSDGEPMASLEAYRFGAEEGYERALRELRGNGGQ